jgi:hypothetical protein
MSAAIQWRRRIFPVSSGVPPTGGSFSVWSVAVCTVCAINSLTTLNFFRIQFTCSQVSRLYQWRNTGRWCFNGRWGSSYRRSSGRGSNCGRFRRSGRRLRFAATDNNSSYHPYQETTTQAHDCSPFVFSGVIAATEISFSCIGGTMRGDFMLLISVSSATLLDPMEDGGCTLMYPLAY